MTAPYTAGTISLVSGSPTVVGTDTAWEISLIAGGTIYVQFDGGNPLPIATVDSDTEITAALNWTGPTGTYSYAIMRDTAYGQQTVTNAQALATYIQRLNNPALAAAAGVTPSADTILLFTGPNTATVIDLEDLSGDVVGPSSAVNNFPVAFDGTTGKLIKPVTGAIAALHALTPDADKLPYFSGPNAASLADLTAFARTILDDANGAAMYATMGATQSKSSPGYVKLPNGIIIQWGRSFVNSDAAITLPIVFPTGVFTKMAVCEIGYTPTATRVVTIDNPSTLDTITVRFRDVTNGGTVSAPTNGIVAWIAIGY